MTRKEKKALLDAAELIEYGDISRRYVKFYSKEIAYGWRLSFEKDPHGLRMLLPSGSVKWAWKGLG